MARDWRRLLAVVGLAVAGLLVWSGSAAGQRASQSGPPVEISVSGSLRGNTAIYSITLKNVTSTPVQDIFVAGSVPQGSIFQRALDTPGGSWLRGFEGAGTSLQSVAWLAKTIPANGTVGPFSYVVERGQATALRARAFTHFRLPVDSTAVSPDADIALVSAPGTQGASTLHDTHTKTVGLSCNSCHGANAAGYSDPLASVANPVDKNACLGCHSAGPKPFYGDAWDTVVIR